MAARKPLGKRLRANLGKKWFQVLLTAVGLCAGVHAAERLLGPKEARPSDKKDAKVFKHLHCDRCKMEIPFQPELDGRPCPRCRPPKAGFYVATKTSLKDGGDGSPWRRYNIAVAVLGTVWLGAVVWLLSRPVEHLDAFVHRCVHCRGLIRYWRHGFGEYALCPECQKPVKLPDEEEALTMDDYDDEKTEGLVQSMEFNLRATGTIPDETADPPADSPATEPDGGRTA